MPARTVLVLLVLVLALWPRPVVAAPGFTDTCEQALPKEEIDRLTEAMRAVDLDSPCTLGRVNTSMFRTLIEWRHGEQTLAMFLSPRGCMVEPSHEGEDLAYWAPPEIEAACPAALAGLRAFVGEAREELMPVVHGQAPVADTEPGVEPGFDPATPLILASVAWIGALITLVLAGLQARRAALAASEAARRELRELGVAMALCAGLALALRFIVTATITNWYGPFLPAEGLGELRFGASSTVLQLVVRALTPWTAAVAFAVVRITGALAIPLIMLVVHRLVARRLGASLGASIVAGLLLALAPIAARMSASSSEHVLAGTLALGAWAVWLRSAVDESVVPRLLALALVLLAVLARVDCWPQLALIPLWTVLATPSDTADAADASRPKLLPLGRRLGDAVFFGLCWAAIGVYAYYRVVIPSNHPGPELAGVRYTARVLFTQLWTASVEPPHWISPVCLALVILGLVAALARRRVGLVVAAVLSWALIFVPLGRNLTHDGLTGARYFVLALPVLAVLAAQVGEEAEALISRRLTGARARWRRPALAGAALLLALAGGVAARPSWRHEYTFQAEYLWLAEQLDGRELDGCTLWFVRPRQPTREPDLDCCLAPDRSPLALVAPQLRFRSMPHEREPADEQGCHLYYVGSLCSIEPSLAPGVERGVARIHEQCERLRGRAGGAELGRQEVTMDNLDDRFSSPPIIELFEGPRERR